jgi:ATP-dependent phosphofructokinase / diphosphate-dependent phosphofructokinase
MGSPQKRIAVNFGHGYLPGLNAAIAGVVLTAGELGWEVIGIRDGFDGLLLPQVYPDGGLVTLSRRIAESLSDSGDNILGTAGWMDPFSMQTVSLENEVEETDRSDELLDAIKAAGIDAVISVVGRDELGVAWKLARKGLTIVCIPKSVENDVEGTPLSFGFNSTLSFLSEILERARQAARSARVFGVVEVPGEHAGWLALQAGMSVCADAVLIPEIPYDLDKVAARLRKHSEAGRRSGLIVVAEGATPADRPLMEPVSTVFNPLKAALSPLATEPDGLYTIDRTGFAAESIARQLQQMTGLETYPLVLGKLAKAGPATVFDRQLGLGYGAGAVRALELNQDGVMVVFQPPDVKTIPLMEAINRFRTVPVESELLRTARALGISLGD